MKAKYYLLTLLLVMPFTAKAGDNDAGLTTELGVEKKITKKFSLGAEVEYRSRNSFKTTDRWSFGLAADVKLASWLKASAGYNFLYDNREEKITYKSSGEINNWRPSYWSYRHRLHADLTGKVQWGIVEISLRERWQYTYRPAQTTTRYDFDNSYYEDDEVSSKAVNVLRSRVQIELKPYNSAWTPYANIEFYNSWGLDKTKFTIGTDYKINKKNSVGAYYRFQKVNSSDNDDESSMNYLGVTYKFKF